MLFWLAVIVIIDEIVLWRRSVDATRPARARPRSKTLVVDLSGRRPR
jgi:hypothetical protein